VQYIAFTLPAPSENAEEVRAFVSELLGPRRAEMEASWRRKGVRREMAWLQRSEAGSLVVVFLEADDPGRFYRELASSQEPFDVWYRQRVLDVYGIDLALAQAGPPVELIASWPD
jgi:hypothetical protein